MKKLQYTKPEIAVCVAEPYGLMRNVGSGTVDPIDILGKENEFEEDEDFDNDFEKRLNLWEE